MINTLNEYNISNYDTSDSSLREQNPNLLVSTSDLLSIKCYFCNYKTNNKNIILIRKVGRKLFRIETNCNKCGKFKSKVFCDSYNKLPYNFYNIIQNKIYILSENFELLEGL